MIPQGRPLSQHSNGEDGQQSASTAKSVVGAKVSQLAHLFQSRSKTEESGATSPNAAAVPPVSPTSSVPLPVAAPLPTAAVVGGRTKPSSRSETDKETTTHQDVIIIIIPCNYSVNDWKNNDIIFFLFFSGSDFGSNCRADGKPIGAV